MKTLYRMNFDCGSSGCLNSIFIADDEDMQYLIDNNICVYFGDVLGKHSEIYGYITNDDIEEITNDEKVVSIAEKYALECGYNPFEEMLLASDTDDLPDISKDEMDFNDFTIQEYIDYKRKGIIPEYYIN